MPVGQLIRFGLIGAVATATHVALFVILIEWLGIRSAGANVVAYLVASIVGYAGHSAWTFRLQRGNARRGAATTYVKFVLASLCGLGLNALVVYAIVELLEASYLYAIPFMATIVPLTVFLLNRLWVFSDARAIRPGGPDR